VLEKMLKAAQKTDLETELQVETAVVELALRGMVVPEMDGLRLDDIITVTRNPIPVAYPLLRVEKKGGEKEKKES
jgi:hypothetical protein